MTGFLSKIFGGNKKSETTNAEALVQEILEGLLSKGGFELSFYTNSEMTEDGENIYVELEGADDDLVRDKEGQMLDAVQLFVHRIVQHNFPENKINILIDCGGYKEESSQALVDLAEKLKGIALEKGKSVYFRALPPKDRKIIHQYLASDGRVKSRSIGDGLYKKIKIYPTKQGSKDQHDTQYE